MRMLFSFIFLILLPFGAFSQGATSLYNEAVDYYMEGEYQKAREHIKLALKIQKTYPDAWFVLGQCFRQQGKYNKAVKYYNKALKLTPTEPEYTFHRALAWEQKGKLKKAVKHYKLTTVMAPKYGLAWDRLGGIYFAAHAYESSAESYTNSVRANPMKIETFLHRAEVFEALELFGAMMDDCNLALALDAESPAAYRTRARARFNRGEFLESVNDYTQVVERDSSVGEDFLNRAVALLLLDLRPQGREDLDRAIARDSSLANAWWNRAMMQYDEADFDGARDDLEQLAKVNRFDAEAWFLLGKIAFQQRDYKSAIRAYNHSIALSADGAAEAHLNRGEAKRVLGDLKGACKDWHKVLTLDNGDLSHKAENWILINCD